MTQEIIDNAIYNRYILPTKKKRELNIGIEIEMPVVNLSGEAGEEWVSIEVAKRFREYFNFKIAGRDADGNVNSMIDKQTGDDLSFDCAYLNLEISLGKGKNLFEIKKRFEKYYSYLNKVFAEYGYTLTGMGINPNYNVNHNIPVPNERYRMLYHYLHSYKNYKGKCETVFHNRPDFATFASASQVQLDVNYENLIDVINTFGRLEPFKALIFANSYMSDSPQYLCSRNMLWEHSMQGYNPHNIGMFDEDIVNAEELLNYIKTQSIYCTMRNGKYINFTPVPISDYFKLDKIEGEYFDGEKYRTIVFKPELSDIEHFRTFKFEDLTFRGTIEFRSSCTQPISESMTVAAFHIGCLLNLEKLKEFVYNENVLYTHGYNALELQKLMSKRKLPDWVDRHELKKDLKTILSIASVGLKSRGFGEEILLRPLFDRAEKLTNPALEIVNGLENGKEMGYFIEKYSKLLAEEE